MTYLFMILMKTGVTKGNAIGPKLHIINASDVPHNKMITPSADDTAVLSSNSNFVST